MPKKRFTDYMESSVSVYAYGIAFLLVVYMLGSVFFGFVEFFSQFQQIVGVSGLESEYEKKDIEKNLLHTIAFAIVLIKAFTILMAYGRTHHINIKFILEIAIIGPIIEVIFNAHAYSLGLNIIFGTIALISAIIYLFFYQTLKEVDEDYRKHDGKNLNIPFAKRLKKPIKKFDKLIE